MSDDLSARLKQEAFVLLSVTELTVTLGALHESDERIWTELDGCNCPLATAQSFADAEAATDYVIAGLARWLNPPAPTR